MISKMAPSNSDVLLDFTGKSQLFGKILRGKVPAARLVVFVNADIPEMAELLCDNVLSSSNASVAPVEAAASWLGEHFRR